jgi:hypothetical protein
MTDKKPTGRCGSVIFMFSCDFKGKGPSA